MAMVIGGSIAAAGALGAGAMQSSAASGAASTQAGAAYNATAAQLAMFQKIQSNLQPWMSAGTSALSALNKGLGIAQPVLDGAQQYSNMTADQRTQAMSALLAQNGGDQAAATAAFTARGAVGGQGFSDLVPSLAQGPSSGPAAGSLIAPFQPTMAQLAATPGYQFTKTQGEQAVQNSYAVQGLESSGSALKGAANYAEGLASTTYQQQFQNYWTQNLNIANLLSGVSNTGETAAAQTGVIGNQAITSANNFATSGAAASAAGQIGSANALGGAVSSLGNLGMLYSFLNQPGMYGGAGSSGGGLSFPGYGGMPGGTNPLT